MTVWVVERVRMERFWDAPPSPSLAGVGVMVCRVPVDSEETPPHPVYLLIRSLERGDITNLEVKCDNTLCRSEFHVSRRAKKIWMFFVLPMDDIQ